MKNKLKILFLSIIIGLAAGIVVLAFTGPGTRAPGTGDPDFWIRSGSDVYYNVSGGNVGIGTDLSRD
ncbi:hypothetical protein COS59_00715 [Candidatus Wolfebacteria bacterium CG03_land_8_20_14_0_80_36_15]|uniref:Uncharacterized protein n=1 Tax=Candidatus Wolfebacteria bacterium CG03_land_8_20_14_0_80_36_15 TaxID=1975067 RepID=A0A2M7B855_9BACT|nr:MAG: hypothetical protein COS59_00715 [Candidatus Wolfebacteria bacterium CG03_land_8_20_14_0_80_36_15]